MEWIPCTKRLPEKSGRYLVTRKSNDLPSFWARVYIANYSDLMGLKKEKIWWTGNVGKSDFEKFDDVIAWMPLPDPYKTDTESYKAFTELYKIFTDNEKICKGCHYNDGGVHAECIVCDKAEKRKENMGLIDALEKEFGDVKREDCFGDNSNEDDSTVPAHWIEQEHKIFKCSHCGNYLDFRGVNAGRGAANYCPNCGAKMWNILTKKPQKSKVMFFKKKPKFTKREKEIRRYIFDEYTEALCIVALHKTPETIAREDEASKILGKILDILGCKEGEDE